MYLVFNYLYVFFYYYSNLGTRHYFLIGLQFFFFVISRNGAVQNANKNSEAINFKYVLENDCIFINYKTNIEVYIWNM